MLHILVWYMAGSGQHSVINNSLIIQWLTTDSGDGTSDFKLKTYAFPIAFSQGLYAANLTVAYSHAYWSPITTAAAGRNLLSNSFCIGSNGYPWSKTTINYIDNSYAKIIAIGV